MRRNRLSVGTITRICFDSHFPGICPCLFDIYLFFNNLISSFLTFFLSVSGLFIYILSFYSCAGLCIVFILIKISYCLLLHCSPYSLLLIASVISIFSLYPVTITDGRPCELTWKGIISCHIPTEHFPVESPLIRNKNKNNYCLLD